MRPSRHRAAGRGRRPRLSSRRPRPSKEQRMGTWLDAALDYVPQWLDYQMRQSEQPGCVVAVAQEGEIRLERAFGLADLQRGIPLTPRHRFRVASHSNSLPAA